jgi:hypothetical protein
MRLVFIFSLGLAGLLAGSGTADEDVKRDQAAQSVKMFVLVEARGVFRLTKEGMLVETREEVRARARNQPEAVRTQQQRWQLDATAIKLTPDELKKLDGKLVEVSGKAELQWVIDEDDAGPGGPFPKVATPRLELQRRIVASTLKEIAK